MPISLTGISCIHVGFHESKSMIKCSLFLLTQCNPEERDFSNNVNDNETLQSILLSFMEQFWEILKPSELGSSCD